jgi:sialidase-1
MMLPTSAHKQTNRSTRFMSRIEVIDHQTIYDNPIPSLKSRHAFFPGLERLPNGDILAMYPIGEAFESADTQLYISRSTDNGGTWSKPQLIHPRYKKGLGSMKPTLLDDGSLVAIGYQFHQADPEVLGNPETGGLPPGKNIISFSTDGGITWTPIKTLKHNRPEVFEFSGPAIQLRSGDVIGIGTAMPMWDGTKPSGHVGIMIRSKNRGKTWNDKTVYWNHPTISPYEARLCQMADGRVVAIVWALEDKTGKCHNNHVVVSHDDGQTWSNPIDTGVSAQASNVVALSGDRLLSIHAHRQTEPVGVFVRIVDFSGDRWRVNTEASVWDRAAAFRVTGFKDMGVNLKFGQPALLPLGNGEYLAYHWAIENGQGRILSHRIRVQE